MKYAKNYREALEERFEDGPVAVFEDGDIAALFPPRRETLNKGDCGSVAILAGEGSFGAPLMAVGAALRSGAGYTKLFLPHTDSRETDEMRRTVFSAKYPACIVNFYAGEPLSDSAIAFGMGAGMTPATKETLETLLKTYENGTLVLDADALNTLSAEKMHGLLKGRGCSVVVTPHPKEFSRISGRSIYEILSDPIAYARAFAEEYGVTVVLKDHRTVITDGKRVVLNMTGSPALAKGGSGDALSGFLAGTVARGLAPFEAAVASCYVLGRAGEIAALDMGEYSPDATDVTSRIPAAIKGLYEA